uniref:Uncharacterized protein n=1 Tax=Anguilla anguilla TaxID=7936 RepID=A0A0E9XSZ4_ANGAN
MFTRVIFSSIFKQKKMTCRHLYALRGHLHPVRCMPVIFPTDLQSFRRVFFFL